MISFCKCNFYTLTFVPEILILIILFFFFLVVRKCHVLFLSFVILVLCAVPLSVQLTELSSKHGLQSAIYVGQWSAKWMSLITCFDFHSCTNSFLYIILHLASVKLGSKKLQALTILVFQPFIPSSGLLLNRFERCIYLLSFNNRVCCRK